MILLTLAYTNKIDDIITIKGLANGDVIAAEDLTAFSRDSC